MKKEKLKKKNEKKTNADKVTFFSSPVGAGVDLILPTQPTLCHS